MDEGTVGIVGLGTEKQKANLYRFDEFVPAAAPFELQPTKPELWEVYPKRNQKNQTSCVYHARAKAAGVLHKKKAGKFIVLSAADYNKRSNKPSLGSFPVEAFDKWISEGIGLEHLEPSNDITEQELAAGVQGEFEAKVAKASLLDGYVSLKPYDFDTLISTLAKTDKPIPVGFYATYKEWNQDIPTIDGPLDLSSAAVRHEVCATPNFGIWQGKEGFTIEDSWGTAGIDGSGVRWITREIFAARNYIPGLWPTSFKNYQEIGIDPERPKFKFTRDLEFGMTGEDVHMLQAIYKYEGTFPANHPGSMLFWTRTLDCTKKFQVKHGITGPGLPGYGRVGPKTRAKLNSIYG